MPYYNHHIQSKLPKIGTTIFTTMSKLANDHGAINLSQGFPDFDVDERLKNLAIILKKDHINMRQCKAHYL